MVNVQLTAFCCTLHAIQMCGITWIFQHLVVVFYPVIAAAILVLFPVLLMRCIFLTLILGTGSSHQLVDITDGERRVSGASTDSIYLSTAFQHVGERTLRSLPDNITSLDGSESSTSKMEISESSDSSLTSSSGAKTEEYNALSSEVQSTEPSTQHLLEHSSLVPLYLASSKDSSSEFSLRQRVKEKLTAVCVVFMALQGLTCLARTSESHTSLFVSSEGFLEASRSYFWFMS